LKICSREYRLRFKKSVGGAHFYCNGPNSYGNGLIEVGDYPDLPFIGGIIIHEALEAILYEDGKRLCPPVNDGDHSRYVFLFDHDYLDGLQNKILDALLTSGFFKLKDGRKRKMAKKSKGKGSKSPMPMKPKKGCK
jgi:hypothetical protein